MQMVAVSSEDDATRLHIAAFLLFSLDDNQIQFLDDRRYLELEYNLEEALWKDLRVAGGRVWRVRLMLFQSSIT